jgi:hypothetical protein
MDQGEEKQKHPLTGEPFDEETERQRLIPLGPKKELVTPEMQRAFAEDYLPRVTRGLDTLRVVEDKLFYSGEYRRHDSVNYHRCYVIPRHNDFSDHAMIEMLINQKIEHLTVLLLGEQVDIEYSEKDRFRIEYEPEGETEVLSISGVINKRRIYAAYNNNGNLEDFYMNSATHLHEDPDFTLDHDQIYTNVDKIRKLGKILFTARGYVYELGFDEENDNLTLKRKEDEELKDSISIPLKLNIEDVINTLVSREIFNDPVQADLKYDESWKNANFETFGVKWHRE